MERDSMTRSEGVLYIVNFIVISLLVVLILFSLFIFPYVFFETGHAMPPWLHTFETWLEEGAGVSGFTLDAMVYAPFIFGIMVCGLISTFITKRLEFHRWRGKVTKALNLSEDTVVTQLDAAKRRAEAKAADEMPPTGPTLSDQVGELFLDMGFGEGEIPLTYEEIEAQLWENTTFTRHPFFWLMLFIAGLAGILLVIDLFIIVDHAIHFEAARPPAQP